ncbi:MAG: PEP-CTERM sorting domain-containing protein [Candidatus Brocadiia bacterium]
MRKPLRVLLTACVLLAVCCRFAAAVPSYAVDGSLDDWGVKLERFYWSSWSGWGIAFEQDSFVPDPLGTINYTVQDYWPSDNRPYGGEEYDYEAMYMDDTVDSYYLAVIVSHPWEWYRETNTLLLTVNGVTVQQPDFEEFISVNLGMSERIGGYWYPNYLWEARISKSRFPYPTSGTSIYAYANQSCGNDSIDLNGDTNHVIPEPTTVALLAMGLVGLGAVGRKKRGGRT